METEVNVNTSDRCDACGAQAWYFGEVNGTLLSYCGHHGTEYEVNFLPVAKNVRDLRYLIAEVR